MSSYIRAGIIAGFLVAYAVAQGGCRAGETTDGGPRIGGPSPTPLAVTPQPPRVGGGTVEVVQALEAAPTATEEPTAIAFTPTATVTPVARLPPPEAARVESPDTADPSRARVAPDTTTGTTPGDSLEGDVRAAVERYFPPSEWATAMRIAKCESGYQPWAVEPGGAHFGVFQVDPSLHGAVPSDADGQVRQAADLWSREGWGPWQCR